jgi:hypothetical protein
MKKSSPTPSPSRAGLYAPLLLLGVIALLFWRSFAADYVHFSNDGPLGQTNVNWLRLPSAMTGMWDDLNEVGANSGTFTPSIRTMIFWALGPVGYSKFYSPISLLILGLGAWAFFRALKLSPLAATLGALAAMLSSTFFAGACWGIASLEIAIGLDFLALALVMANQNEAPWLLRWARFALAGLCVGVNVIEAADVGALSSILVAGFIFYKSLVAARGNFFAKSAHAVIRIAVVAGFAGFIAFQAILSLVGTSITGVAGTAQDAATKSANWDKATQWSVPKTETLGLFVPGLFGYKMDTPKDMMPQVQDAYRGGVYWGGIGRDPAIDRYLAAGGTAAPPQGFMRFTGGGNYCGILVLLIGAWTVAQSFRRQNSLFTAAQKLMIWFWAAVLVLSVPLMWGRFAPFSTTSDSPLFYALLYKLPYFSTIRNPCKFVIFLAWALVILFAYGVNALQRRYLDPPAVTSSGLVTQVKSWWAKAGAFDRKWTFICGGCLIASALAWLIYSAQQPGLVQFLQKMGFPDEDFAKQIAAFSVSQVGWFVLLFAIAIALMTLVLAGYFAGPRAKTGALLLGAFLLFDLVRANLPYVIHWDYKQKYEVGSLNPVLELLTQKPYEQRVAGLPFETQQQLRLYDSAFGGSGIYRIEWMQHHFPYYNIQCLDIIQMPRMPEDLKAYLEALSPHSQADAPLMARHWELTNTRYLLGAAGFLDILNQQLDPVQHRFRIAQRFDIIAKPGVTHPTQLEELTATLSPDGDLALFEFNGALPRAMLYANWQVNTNDQAVLKTLADLNFDPAKTVLVSTPQKELPAVATGENSGSVEFQSYSSKHIVFAAQAAAPSVLLLNDRYDANWHVTVDGRPAPLLRCNFLMRGVYLPAGPHTVDFYFSLPSKPLYVTLAAFGVAVLLSAFLALTARKRQAVAS